MWIPFVIALLTYIVAKAKDMKATAGRVIAIVIVSTIISFIVSIVAGAFFPSMAVVLKTQAEWINAIEQYLFGAVAGLVTSSLVVAFGTWLARPSR